MSNSKKISMLALYIAVAFIFSYIESLLPLPFPIPGIKLGLANIVLVIVLSTDGLVSALVVALFRNLLNAFTFGNLFAFFYSLAGSLLSLLIMWLFLFIFEKKKKDFPQKKPFFSLISISAIGGIFHNLGQFIIAVLLVGCDAILYYLPFLYFSGLITGILIGILSHLCLTKLPAHFLRQQI